MKVITDYFSLPHTQNKLVRGPDHSKLEKTERKSEVHYELRKIRIRLSDPSDPTSYICEVYDTSNEEFLEEDIGESENYLNNKDGVNTSIDIKNRTKVRKCGKNTKNNSNVLIEKNITMSEPAILCGSDNPISTRRQSTRARKQVIEVTEETVLQEEPSKKKPRPRALTPLNPSGSITNYFKRIENSKKQIENSELDCIIVKEKVKLAPLFLPPPKKQKIDPEIEKARKAFLQSGIPSSIKKLSSTTHAVSEEVSFWAVAHVQQRCEESVWKKRTVNLELKKEDFYSENRTYLFSWSCNPGPKFEICPTKKRKIGEKVLDKLKLAYKQVPVEKIYSSLKDKPDLRKEPILWSDRYRPNTAGVLGNEKTVEILREWLQEWQSSGGRQQDREGSDSSDEESVGLQTACLLVGPVASGKTCLVYALATELEMNVIEINASSKRSGKRLLTELQEATRSHEVREDSRSALILVEDVDIVFDEDEGFLPALQNLVSSTKRPVVLLASDMSSELLDRFRGRQSLELQMVRPHSSTGCALLELICHMEGACPPRSSLLRLLVSNNFDIRRSLLELQLWNGRGGWELDRDDKMSAASIWWSSHQALFGHPLHHDSYQTNSEDNSKPTDLHKMKYFTSFFDSLSYSDLITKRLEERPVQLSWNRVCAKDSISLLEDHQVYSWRAEKLSQDISSAILRLASPKTENLEASAPPSELRWTESRLRANADLTAGIAKCTGRSVPMEYLPTLRTMLRAEIDGATTSRRRSRGSHYLRTLGITPSVTNKAILSSTFRSEGTGKNSEVS